MDEPLPDWPIYGLADDQRSALRNVLAGGAPAVLATIAALDGGGPRPVGTQMVFGSDLASGFLSGGCVEGDVAGHARACRADGEPRRLIYGAGSPWPDIRLLCGARIEILLERIAPDDPATAELFRRLDARRPAIWASDGRRRTCGDQAPAWPRAVVVRHDPVWRLVVLGGDPTALATAQLGAQSGFETRLVRPRGPATSPPLVGVSYDRQDPGPALAGLDAWTAVAVCGHDIELDHAALVAALPSPAPYVGLLGARRRMPERLERLRVAGLSERDLARLRAPIGLDLGGKAPWEVAVSVIAEIMAVRHAQPVVAGPARLAAEL
ncbi:XdhC family protein [Caulobacter mirabilis]|uniref:Xanthine dehydrogenase n=1 Tax=Caulobacter mirabilis TaxID=69666 RepID=A0A2D2ASX1_9CAUL|nr:XdhC family protein [Caulobacter mirabilis]ATQ41104.1 xanthine dehydrogenase [Caulobacter mirabilis]